MTRHRLNPRPSGRGARQNSRTVYLRPGQSARATLIPGRYVAFVGCAD
jgi:hypothetical protein